MRWEPPRAELMRNRVLWRSGQPMQGDSAGQAATDVRRANPPKRIPPPTARRPYASTATCCPAALKIASSTSAAVGRAMDITVVLLNGLG